MQLQYGMKDTSGFWGVGSLIFASAMLLLFVGYCILYLKRPAYFGEYVDSFKKDKFASHFYLVPMLERVSISVFFVVLLRFRL